MRLALGLAGVAVVVWALYAGNGNARAAEIVDRWLAAMSAGSAADAWAAMHPVTREAVYGDDVTRLAADLAAAEWPGARWHAVDPRFRNGQYIVALGSTAPISSLPAFLIERRLVDITTRDGRPVPYVVVLIGFPIGPAGVLSNGP